MGALENLGNWIYGIKSAIPGASQWNIVPGDVNKALTGIQAQDVYGGPGIETLMSQISSADPVGVARYNRNQGQVLGNSANRNQGQVPGSSASGGGFDMSLYPGWNEPEARADFAATGGPNRRSGGGGETQRIEDLISEQYGPALKALEGIEGSLLTGKEEATGNVKSQYTRGGETIGGEQLELEASLAEQGRRLGESARSAYADATRAYNNLIQQGLSRFGAGSSAGPAVQELVNQEFLRSRGKMGQQEVQGQESMALEQTKLNNYISQKKGDLDTWKDDAILKINENFRSSMDEIAFRKGDIEANKTRDKIAALQSAVNQANEVKNADRTYRLGLAQFAVEQMQTFANRAFTPQEIATVVNQMMGQELSGFSQNTGGPALSYSNINPSQLGKKIDEFGNVVNP